MMAHIACAIRVCFLAPLASVRYQAFCENSSKLHSHLQGKSVCEHLATRFVAMELEANRRDETYNVPQLKPLESSARPQSHDLPRTSAAERHW